MIEYLFSPFVGLTVLLGVLLVWLFFRYSSRNHDYWKNMGVPYVKPLPFLGSVYENSTTPFHEVEIRRYKTLGKVYGHFEGNRPVLSVGDPDLLREIMVKDFHIFPNRRLLLSGDRILDNMVANLEGEDWKRVRSIITPTFTTGKIKRMLNIFKECSRSAVQNFLEESKKGKSADAKMIFGAFAMDVIASAAFSTKIDSHNDPENRFVQTARNLFTRNVSWRFLAYVLAPKLVKLFKISLFGSEGPDFFRSVTMQIIEDRRRTGQKRNDFLQLLLDTATEVSANADGDHQEELTDNYGEGGAALDAPFKNVSSKNLSMDELVANCIVFFLAGFDTVASALAFASYLLALHPDKQETLRQEVDRTLEEGKGELTYEGIQSMKYLDNVVSETLRIFPPAVRLERQAVEDYKLGDTGITIPKGMIISIPAIAMHKDPNHWTDPEVFEPDRFSVEGKEGRHQYAYLPFGSGPRNCVGMRFALVEIKVCLALVVARFVIKKSPETKVPLDFYLGQQLLQPKNIILDFEERKDAIEVL